MRIIETILGYLKIVAAGGIFRIIPVTVPRLGGRLHMLRLRIVDKVCKPSFYKQKEGEYLTLVDFHNTVENDTTKKVVTCRKSSLRNLTSKLDIKVNQSLIYIYIMVKYNSYFYSKRKAVGIVIKEFRTILVKEKVLCTFLWIILRSIR